MSDVAWCAEMATSSSMRSNSTGDVTNRATLSDERSALLALAQQELFILLHAHSCRRRQQSLQPKDKELDEDALLLGLDAYCSNVSSAGTAAETKYTCTMTGCYETQSVLVHMTTCSSGTNCTVPRCALLRNTILHWSSCVRDDCALCSSVRSSAVCRSVPADFASISPLRTVPSVAVDTLALPLTTDAEVMPLDKSSTAINSEVAEVGLRTSWVMDSAPPLLRLSALSSVAAAKQPVDWRGSVWQESRDRFVQRIVDALSLNLASVPLPPTAAIGRSSHVIDYARKLESDMYDTAVSRHDYHCMIAEKIARLINDCANNITGNNVNSRDSSAATVGGVNLEPATSTDVLLNHVIQDDVVSGGRHGISDVNEAITSQSNDHRTDSVLSGDDLHWDSLARTDDDDDDDDDSSKSAEIADSVIADIADVKVAASSIQGTPTRPIPLPVLDLSRPWLTRVPNVSRDSLTNGVPLPDSSATQTTIDLYNSVIDLTKKAHRTAIDFIDLTSESDEPVAPPVSKKCRIDVGKTATATPPSSAHLSSPARSLPWSLSWLPQNDDVTTSVGAVHPFRPVPIKSEDCRSDNINQSRRKNDDARVNESPSSTAIGPSRSAPIPVSPTTDSAQQISPYVPPDIPTICVDYMLRGSFGCARGDLCSRHHSENDQPYQWQWRRTVTDRVTAAILPPVAAGSYGSSDDDSIERWTDFGRAANIEIERAFCDETRSGCSTALGADTAVQTWQPSTSFYINFERMVFEDVAVGGRSSVPSGIVRRLQVAETDVEPAADDLSVATNALETSRRQFLTVWQWFWLNDFAWQAYESKTLLRAAGDPAVSSDIAYRQQQLFSLTTGYIFSETIEQAYRLYPFGWFSFSCLHPVDQSAYVIDFQQAIQINQFTGRRRPIRRRPAWVLPGRPSTPIEAVISNVVRFPSTWDMSLVNDDVRYQQITVSGVGSTTVEYQEIVGLFNRTMNGLHGRLKVKSIRRIQNRSLWERFAQFCSDAERTRRRPLAVRRLFHGTKQHYVEAICSNGFDWRLSGTSTGTVYGKGSYFARDASYSATYTDCRKIFLVQVAVGDFALGNSTIVHPPPKNLSRPFEDFYDSCVDDVINPSIFVTFDRCQSYPEYIIEY